MKQNRPGYNVRKFRGSGPTLGAGKEDLFLAGLALGFIGDDEMIPDAPVGDLQLVTLDDGAQFVAGEVLEDGALLRGRGGSGPLPYADHGPAGKSSARAGSRGATTRRLKEQRSRRNLSSIRMANSYQHV
jgi:hypothetical protein